MSPLTEELKKQEILDQLTWDASVNANNIQVEVSDQTVLLKGKVDNYAAKLAAERDAMMVDGVNNLESFLEIRFPEGIPVPSDNKIKENTDYMLDLNSRIDSENIKVEASRGVVTLSGKVSSYWEKYAAGIICGNIKGVMDVQNNLSVALNEDSADAEIGNEIKKAFRRSMLITEDRIAVEVINGSVKLTGSVSGFPVKQEALNIATHTSGVTGVTDEITIG